MVGDRIYCTAEELLALRFAGARISLDFNARKMNALAGTHVSRRRGPGLDFAGHRIYQPGDDIRALDWKLTARRARPYIRMFNEELERPVVLIVDQRMSMFFGSKRCFKSVQAADIAALLLWAAFASHDRVGGVVLGATDSPVLPPAREHRHALRFFGAITAANQALNAGLAVEQRALGTDLGWALQEVLPRLRPGALCCIISDWTDYSANLVPLLQNLRRHAACLAIRVFDPLEDQFPAGRLRISDGVHHQWMRTDRPGLRDKLATLRTAQLNALAQGLRTAGIPLLPISTSADPAEALARLAVAPGRMPRTTGLPT